MNGPIIKNSNNANSKKKMPDLQVNFTEETSYHNNDFNVMPKSNKYSPHKMLNLIPEKKIRSVTFYEKHDKEKDINKDITSNSSSKNFIQNCDGN